MRLVNVTPRAVELWGWRNDTRPVSRGLLIYCPDSFNLFPPRTFAAHPALTDPDLCPLSINQLSLRFSNSARSVWISFAGIRLRFLSLYRTHSSNISPLSDLVAWPRAKICSISMSYCRIPVHWLPTHRRIEVSSWIYSAQVAKVVKTVSGTISDE